MTSRARTAFDDARHRQSEELALRAEQAWSDGHYDEGRRLFEEAAGLEEAVAREVTAASTIGSVLAISAVALWYKAAAFDRAKTLAYAFLADWEHLAEHPRKQLEEIVDRCSREAELSRFSTDPGMIPVEVKLEGGRVGVGIAPAAVARKRREKVASLLMRAADLEAKQPYRERGESELDRNEEIQVFEVPALAASYGMRFYVASGPQQRIESERGVNPGKVVERFLALAAAAEEGPEAVRGALQNDEQYARAFIDGFGEIAPDGEDVQRVLCSAPTWKIPRAPRLVFEPRHRSALRAVTAPIPREPKPGEKTLEGKLVGLHVKSSSQWIELAIAGDQEPEIVMLGDRRFNGKLMLLLDQPIRVFARWAPKMRRRVVLDVEELPRTRTLRP